MTLTFPFTSSRKRAYRAGSVITTTPPSVPPAPVLGSITNPSGTVRRVAITSFPSSATSMIVEFSPNNSSWSSAGANKVPGDTYFDFDTTSNTSWYFRARAVNAGGESANSSIVSGTSGSSGGIVITAASINAGVLTASVTGHGNKTVAAPLKTAFMINSTQGGNYINAGLDFISLNWINQTSKNYVDMTDGIGGGCWLTVCDTPGSGTEYFYHFGHSLPAGTKELYVAYWSKYSKVSGAGGGAGTGQIKGCRTGWSTNYTDPNAAYADHPDFAWSAFCNSSLSSDPAGGQPEGRVHNPVETLTGGQSGNEAKIYDGQWHFIEEYRKWNDVGVPNGIFECYGDGQLCFRATNLNLNQTSAQSEFRYVQYNPGMANSFGQTSINVRHSRMYADNTRARAYLGDASTATACTKKFLLALTGWNSTTVTATIANRPAWATYLYIVDSNGTQNASGFVVS